jgi:transcription-repair coupling factor (superfamily II helicase)
MVKNVRMTQNRETYLLNGLIDSIPHRQQAIDCTGLQGADAAYLVSRIYRRHRMPLIVVTPSVKEGQVFSDDLRFFLGDAQQIIQWFPSYNLLPFKFLSSNTETAAARVRTLYYLMAGDVPPIVITPVTGLMKRVIPRAALDDYAELVMAGEEIDRDHLIEKLHAGGYEHAAIVEEPGDYCVRGGLLDIFSPLYADPVRIELFGDYVESLRFFSPLNQRTLQAAEEVILLPAKESILKKEDAGRIIQRIRQQASGLNTPVSRVRRIIDRIKNEGMFSGAENLMPLFYSNLETLFDYARSGTLFVVTESEALQAAAGESEKQIQKNFEDSVTEGTFCVDPGMLYLNRREAAAALEETRPLSFRMLQMFQGDSALPAQSLSYSFHSNDNADLVNRLRHPSSTEDMLQPLIQWIGDNRNRGFLTAVACAGATEADRLRSVLAPYRIFLETADAFPDSRPGKDHAGRPLLILAGRLSAGFCWPEAAVALLTAHEIFGFRKKKKATPRSMVQRQLLSFEDLKTNDLVVHDAHGIGQYEGLTKLTVEGAVNDFLQIAYQAGDKLYLPVDRMGRIQKYMGVEGVIPVVDKMGGKSWDKVKAKAKKSAEKIAGELLKLYAARKIKKGFAHQSVDKDLQDFETGFLYEETEDQVKVIEDVLKDMSEAVPMDRLICGDVGYGKTEVALRASFVVVYNGRQVAVLVPTTVLAEQHFSTFCERFKNYPVHIACLSRFRSRQEQKEILAGLREGRIDIVIGTHRLLQKDIAFKDLGLFVIDEEQRFGVRHKEKLKKIRTTVDVLALTATPIPRTLHMSLMGVRDISLITTPPEYRRAIVTYVCEFDEGIVKEAVEKELKRDGQIYFVHNNINTIERMAGRLKSIVPDVRLDIAHGRMDERELERVMLRFMNKEIHMLVCTTIIESGLDIPSANTILINRADRFGLAQMYQLRGRVGRAEEQAYAYLFIPDESTIGRDAQKRLKVLMEHSDLGSGFQIAMSDLKIRGGGTILGASQSGHIAAVGYDMFLKLMEESIAELKGEPVLEKLEPEINVTLSAYIPESYIADIDQRLTFYRRFAKVDKLDEIPALKEELIDRYGKLPDETGNLLLKMMLKVMSVKAGVKRLDLNERDLLLHLSPEHQETPHAVVHMIMSAKDRFWLTPENVLKAKLAGAGLWGRLNQTKNILKEIAQRVNGSSPYHSDIPENLDKFMRTAGKAK